MGGESTPLSHLYYEPQGKVGAWFSLFFYDLVMGGDKQSVLFGFNRASQHGFACAVIFQSNSTLFLICTSGDCRT